MPNGLSSDQYLFTVMILIAFFGLMVFLITRPRPIDTVEDANGFVYFRIYQIGINGFLVRGYHGNYRQVSFKTYTEVVAYVDKRINKWF
jgi:hypothetical protein